MKLTYSKPAHLFIWLFVFAVFGPLIGLIQILLILVFYAGMTGLAAFPFGLIYSFLYLIPAIFTGFVIFKIKDKIKKYSHLFLTGLVGSLATIVWEVMVSSDVMRNNVILILITVSYLTTVSLSSLFFYKEKYENDK